MSLSLESKNNFAPKTSSATTSDFHLSIIKSDVVFDAMLNLPSANLADRTNIKYQPMALQLPEIVIVVLQHAVAALPLRPTRSLDETLASCLSAYALVNSVFRYAAQRELIRTSLFFKSWASIYVSIYLSLLQ